MTNFLRASFLPEQLRIMHQELTALRTSLHECGASEASQGADQHVPAVDYLLEMCGELADFLERLPCHPLVYTGEESTEEMVALLDRLLARHRREQEQANGSGC